MTGTNFRPIEAYHEDSDERHVNGYFAMGNKGSKNGGRPRGAKNQLTQLRNEIFDALFEKLNGGDATRLQLAIKHSKPEHILALASKLVPKSVEFTLGDDTQPVPIVLDALAVHKVGALEKPAIAPQGDNNGLRSVLSLDCNTAENAACG